MKGGISPFCPWNTDVMTGAGGAVLDQRWVSHAEDGKAARKNWVPITVAWPGLLLHEREMEVYSIEGNVI